MLDVPVPAQSPGASRATPVPAPTGPGGGWGSPGPGAIGVVPRPTPAPPAGSALPPAPYLGPAIAPHPGPFRQRQRSLSDMANEQLRKHNKTRDPLAEGMDRAAMDDCLHAPRETPQVGGLLAAPGLAARALADRCAR